MSDVKSKNLYELLGNDHDEDSDKEPEAPPKVVDKPLPRTAKRNAPDVAPSEPRGGAVGEDRGGRGGRRGGFNGSEDAFRDRAAGSINNRGKPTDDGLREDRHADRIRGGRIQGNYDGRGGRGGGRGGRGGRGGGRGDDRHSRGVPNEHVKQADQAWGAQTGEGEWNDEQAGEAIAKAEEKEGFDTIVEAPADADGKHPVTEGAGATDDTSAATAQPAADAEPEDNSKSYAEYLAEQAEKKLQLGAPVLEARKPNEGSKQDKKWAQAKPLTKDEEDEAYIAGKGEKARRERQRKEKNRVDVDMSFKEAPQRGGGEGRGRGGRGRGEGRGDFRGGDRGRGGGRGRGDGYRGRSDGEFRGGYRGGHGGRENTNSVDVADESAFPSLGGS
ncbi:telomere and ribosome associated protein stm1 [Lasallia pustulata]|uniref:Telomere and ribosome associated protein stm1 n=1 Tax=Lasallia pustulata TaxID=136370 RepID=A0A1W5DDV5_9LECA|nr:telomere and ribosome associated protein stm1 [Lasallia pustulata]